MIARLINALIHGSRTVGALNRLGITGVLEIVQTYPNMFLVSPGLAATSVISLRFH
jgi:hypothetical protein